MRIVGVFVAFWVLLSCKSDSQMAYEQYLVNGQAIYTKSCANCHGEKGEGLKNLYPKIYQSKVLNDPAFLVCLIKNGKQNKDQKVGLMMPSNPTLYDLDIAQLVTYMNVSFNQTEKMMSADEVKAFLNKCPQ